MELHDDPRARAVHVAVYAAISGADGMGFRTGEGQVHATEIERRAKVNRSTRKSAVRDLVAWGFIETDSDDHQVSDFRHLSNAGAWRGAARFYRLPHLQKGAGKSPPLGGERGRENARKGPGNHPSPYIQRDTEGFDIDEEAEEAFVDDRLPGETWAARARRIATTEEVAP